MESTDQSYTSFSPLRISMSLIREKNRFLLSIIGLILYSFIVYFLFLVLTFPKEKVQRWFFIQFQKTLQTELTVGESHFTFPLGTQWKQISIVPSGKPGPRLVLDQLNVDFLLSSLFLKRSLAAHFDLKGWGGEIRGVVGTEKAAGSHLYSVIAEGEDIDLKNFPWKKGTSVEGKIRFQSEYRWDEKNPERGKGYLNIEGTGINGKGLSISGFTLPDVTLYKMNGHGTIRDGSMILDRLYTSGSLADLNGTGTLLLQVPLQKSLINISMKLIPKENLNKLIPLSFLSPTAKTGLPMDLFLKGTLGDPVFTLTGTPS